MMMRRCVALAAAVRVRGWAVWPLLCCCCCVAVQFVGKGALHAGALLQGHRLAPLGHPSAGSLMLLHRRPPIQVTKTRASAAMRSCLCHPPCSDHADWPSCAPAASCAHVCGVNNTARPTMHVAAHVCHTHAIPRRTNSYIQATRGCAGQGGRARPSARAAHDEPAKTGTKGRYKRYKAALGAQHRAPVPTPPAQGPAFPSAPSGPCSSPLRPPQQQQQPPPLTTPSTSAAPPPLPLRSGAPWPP
jgi:hypothetical protein